MSAQPSPFPRSTVIGMLLVGALAFVALLWFLGHDTGGSGNDGGAHVGGKGLTGYAGLAQMLEAEGFDVQRQRNRLQLESAPGLLVLTPPAEADGKAIGSACRHAMRAIEDCYVLNPKAQKAAVYAGWREMDEYMRENKLEGVAPVVPRPGSKPKTDEDEPAAAEKAPEKAAEKASEKVADKGKTR